MKKIIKKLSYLVAVLVLGCGLFATSTVGAQTKAEICEGVGITGGTTGCATPSGSPTVDSTIRFVINILSFVVGIVAVIMMIIGGFKYIISSGDSSNVNSAKNTILYALIGLVVVVLAQVIVRFVLTNLSVAPSRLANAIVRRA